MNHPKTGKRSVKNLGRHKESYAASTDASKGREARQLKVSPRAAWKGWGKGTQSMIGSSKEMESRQSV